MKACSADGCGETVAANRPFCRLCYFMLPVHVRGNLRDAAVMKEAVSLLRELRGGMKIIYSCVLP